MIINKSSNIYFSATIFSISFAVSSITYLLFGTYFEAYEGLLSSFVHGTYTEYALNEYVFDVHFLMLPIYAKINQIIPDYQFYGWYLFILNIVAHSFLLLYLAKIYLVKEGLNTYTVLILLPISFIISFDNVINLNTTRIVFVLSACIFIHIISKVRSQKLVPLDYIKVILFLIFINLLRIDAALLASIIFLVITLIITKKIHVLYLVPLLIGILSFATYNFALKFSGNEAKKVFYYQELDLIDRNHIDYDNLSKINLLDVEALTQYCIADKNFFSLEDNEKIIGRGKTNIIDSYFNINGFINTLYLSRLEYYSALHIIIMATIVVFLFIYYSKDWRSIALGIIFLLLPIFLCLVIVVPARFLYPYYSILSAVILLKYLKLKMTNKAFLLLLYFFVFICILGAIAKNNFNLKIEKEFSENIKSLEEIQSSNYDEIIIIENLIPNNFIPVSPLKKLKRYNVLFLNLYWFSSFECFQDKWENICSCDPLSITEKLNFIAEKKYPIIIPKERVNFYKRYLSVKYNLNPSFKHAAQFSQNLDVFIVDFP